MSSNISDHVKTGVQGRARVKQLIRVDAVEALRVAEDIKHPWYRCQALSLVGEALPDAAASLSVLGKAIQAAHELSEPNRVVTVASWPIKVLLKRTSYDPAAEIQWLLRLIATEPHSLRRSTALFALLEGVFAEPTLRTRVLSALLESLSVSHGWRAERLWRLTTLAMMAESPESAYAIFQAMPEGKEKRRVARQIALVTEDSVSQLNAFRNSRGLTTARD